MKHIPASMSIIMTREYVPRRAFFTLDSGRVGA